MGSGRVLVVDDEESIRVLCRVNLELGGYEVFDAPNGATAIDVARTRMPNLIFLDVMMPEMDGWEVLSRLKEDPLTASIPVVLLTARTSEEDQIRAWGEGILEYLSKPFNPRMLVEWAAQSLLPRDPDTEAERRGRVVAQLRLMSEMRRQV